MSSNVKAIQKVNEAELRLGLDSKTSWHDEYSNSAYIFIGTVSSAVILLYMYMCMYIYIMRP